jgi:hypothetical protein
MGKFFPPNERLYVTDVPSNLYIYIYIYKYSPHASIVIDREGIPREDSRDPIHRDDDREGPSGSASASTVSARSDEVADRFWNRSMETPFKFDSSGRARTKPENTAPAAGRGEGRAPVDLREIILSEQASCRRAPHACSPHVNGFWEGAVRFREALSSDHGPRPCHVRIGWIVFYVALSCDPTSPAARRASVPPSWASPG